MKSLIKNFFLFFIVFLVIAAVFSSFSDSFKKTDEVGIGTLIQQINGEEIKTITVRGDKVEAILKDGKKETIRKESNESFTTLLRNFDVNPEKSAKININIKDQTGWNYWLTIILPFLLPLLLIGALVYFTMRSVQGSNSKAMSFGQSNAKAFSPDQKNKVSFNDVAGAKEAKEELKEVVDFLKYSKKFHDLGAEIPKGVLLLGAPGTGKTLLARSVAGEANVPFFHISGSEFVEMFVGVGASRVRSLFQKAKKSSPCIVFIDEIDAVGRKRGTGLGGSHDEREQTLNQILVEMDGFEPNQNVIVIAATNRPDVLDPALLRPGRFDRRVIIDLPDIKDREAILKVHVKKKPLDKNVSLRTIAERTPGFSGADLANILNEGAILAVRRHSKIITKDDLFEAIEKVMLGPARKSRIISDKEKKITAYHEAGHAIVAHFLPKTDNVHKVSIISRGQAGGYTLNVPSEDRHLRSKSEFLSELAVLLGGYLIEKDVFGEVTTGASSDLRRATSLARQLVTDYGMSKHLGPRTYGEKEEMIFLGREIHEQRDYSEKIAEKIDKEIFDFLNIATEMVQDVFSVHRDSLERVVKELLKNETIEKETFEQLVNEDSKVD